MIKNFNPFEVKYFNKKSMANNEDKNVAIRPKIRGIKLNSDNSLKEEMNSIIAAREIAGIPNRKENFAASLFSHPEIRAVEIVTPDLEKPGIIANAWEKPIKKLSENLWFFRFIEPFFELLSAINIKIAIRKETNAIDKFERRNLSKKYGTNNLTIPPSKIIGMVPIKIELNNFLWNKISKILFEDWLFNLKIWSLKYQTNAKTLPSCMIADKEGPGSSIPIKWDKTFKWAVLLTGINSVKPWITPYKINFKYSKNL